ncbi:hypothetical protein [Wolbachia endosymbiont of Drosophila barbarae]|uniref:hypothetical protein n=1 Tax=Wolbachia endosymbiont of Drosophila barbarae TaxID=3377043 RepID=UPI00383B646F
MQLHEYQEGVIQVADTGMTAIYVIPRFIRGISDPANKQRDDGCRLAINTKKFTKQKKGKRSPVVIIRFKILAFFMF